MYFNCKCGEKISMYDIYYEEHGLFKAYHYKCPCCGNCQTVIHYQNGKVKIINSFIHEMLNLQEK